MTSPFVQFRCERSGVVLILEILRQEGDSFLIQARYQDTRQKNHFDSRSTSSEAEIPFQTLGQARLPREKLKAMANWLRRLDIESLPDFELGAFQFRLRYGHFEKGEVSYDVSFQTPAGETLSLAEYNQVGNSNEFRARRIRDALG